MKRFTAVTLLSATAALAGAVGIAKPAAERVVPAAFGSAAETLRIDDVWVDAERVFEKVDVDRNGEISVDEYAAQAVVFAGLARFNGLIAIDGRETVHILVPDDVRGELGLAERTAIDAVARGEYYELTEARGALTPRAWVALSVERFAEADRNEDGQLQGRELSDFAMGVAQANVSSNS